MELKPEARPQLRLRGRNFMAVVLAPESPLGDWFAALDAQLRETPGLFAGRPVVADLSAARGESREAVQILLDGLEARDVRLVGVDGVGRGLLTGTRWERLPTELQGREAAAPRGRAAPVPKAALLLDRPVRSGQSIVFEDGDVTVVGAVASGAEVIAGGSIHVYGALRGRAIAGLKSGEARIFCRRMEAEMVGIERLYRTAENWGPDLHGRAVQVRCDRGALRLSCLD
jgi:septum site-determining protein MinC